MVLAAATLRAKTEGIKATKVAFRMFCVTGVNHGTVAQTTHCVKFRRCCRGGEKA